VNAVDPGVSTDNPKAAENTLIEKIKTIGGLVAVVIGVLSVLVIAIVAMAGDSSSSATIASATAGVIATIVGAYFGVKVGSDQSKTANEGQKAEAAKAQVYAAHLPPEKAGDVVRMAEQAARDVLGK
jgi:uncharacterized protein YacL